MIQVIVSRTARADLINISSYVREELASPMAAARIMGKLKKSIESLREYPEKGKPLDANLPVHTDYRFLVCENYRIFYLFDGSSVEVVRVLHTLQDYMRALFRE